MRLQLEAADLSTTARWVVVHREAFTIAALL